MRQRPCARRWGRRCDGMSELERESEEIFARKVAQARRLTLEERFRIGLELCDEVREFRMDAIRAQHPGIEVSEAEKILRERVRRVHAMELMDVPPGLIP